MREMKFLRLRTRGNAQAALARHLGGERQADLDVAASTTAGCVEALERMGEGV
jgi:hypothetical protein